MDEGARILVQVCADVQPDEEVVIVSDEERYEIARALIEAVKEVGTRATVVIDPPRKIDNEEPAPPVGAALKKADVLYLPLGKALSHTQAVRSAIGAGARVVSMSAFTERQMNEGGLFADFHARKPFCDYLATRLTKAREIRVTNPAGTDLTFRLDERAGNSHACIVREPGFTAVPNIEANCAPLEETTQGVLVVDGSIPYYGVGVIREPVTCRIRDGAVTAIEGGGQAEFLRDLLSAQGDPNVYNIAQFAFGLNPECREFTGEMLNDEGVNGTVHIGIGTSASLGGGIQARTHFDAIIRSPSVWFDGEPIMDHGEFLVEESEAQKSV